MAEQMTVRNIPADDLPEVLDMLLEHLGLRLMCERTPDYTSYELVPDGVVASQPEQGEVFWLYELTKGEGVYQGVRGPDAEKIMRQVVSGIEEAGEPFPVRTSGVEASGYQVIGTDTPTESKAKD